MNGLQQRQLIVKTRPFLFTPVHHSHQWWPDESIFHAYQLLFSLLLLLFLILFKPPTLLVHSTPSHSFSISTAHQSKHYHDFCFFNQPTISLNYLLRFLFNQPTNLRSILSIPFYVSPNSPPLPTTSFIPPHYH